METLVVLWTFSMSLVLCAIAGRRQLKAAYRFCGDICLLLFYGYEHSERGD